MTTLHLLRLPLRQTRLAQLASRRRLPSHADDPGYAVHSYLGETFREAAPSVFHVERSRGQNMEVLAYSGRDLSALRAVADIGADPTLHDGIDWESAANKLMPAIPAGKRLRIRARLCPIVRQRRTDGGRDHHVEMDAWMHACCKRLRGPTGRVDPAFFNELHQASQVDLPARLAVYRDWAVALLERQAGVRIDRIDDAIPLLSVEGFRLLRFVRRDKERVPRLVPSKGRQDRGSEGKPEIFADASVTVIDHMMFATALARGIGRHRAFGFGMLLLRPALG
jgi:CRISPR system Cascade subunit CasE